MSSITAYTDLHSLRRDLFDGAFTLPQLVDAYLHRIREVNPELNLFIEVFEKEALERAVVIEEKIRNGTAGRLAGLVIGIKDVICYAGHEVTASSHILKGFRSQITSTALERLLSEDAIVIGRQGCDEFAMGSSNESSVYGPARLPHDPTRTPGGSSGASAAAVAAGCCHASLGSDTGGSVRQPAGFCGVWGAKPTFGRISRWGLIAYASSFDQIGPLTKSGADARLLLEIMTGPDGRDHTALEENWDTAKTWDQARPLRIAFFREVFDGGLDPEVEAASRQWLAARKAEGHVVEEVSFPLLPYLVPCYYMLTTAEASSNLLRFDGIRYGDRAAGAKNLQDLYVRSRSEGFGKEVQKRILLGAFVLSAGFYDAYYQKAQKVRRLIRDETEQLFSRYDLIFSPTSPTPSFKLGEKATDPISMYLADIFTVHANLAGIPAITFPMALSASGLPIGGQLMATAMGDEILVQIAENLGQTVKP